MGKKYFTFVICLVFLATVSLYAAESAYKFCREGDKIWRAMMSGIKSPKTLVGKKLIPWVFNQGYKAEGFYRDALERDPNYAYASLGSAMVNLLMAQASTGDHKSEYLSKSESFAHEALRKRKNYAPAYVVLGESYALQEKWSEAETVFTRLKKGGWENSIVLGWLGYIYGKMGSKDEAVGYLDKAASHYDPVDIADWSKRQTHSKKGKRLKKIRFKRMKPPPLYVLRPPRQALQHVSSYKFRLAVFNLIDQTGNAGDLVKTIPDILTTSLFKTARFDMYDRGQLRAKSQAEVEKLMFDLKHKAKADGILQGSITRFSPESKTMTLDVRVNNVASDAVMFAKSMNVGYSGIMDVEVNRVHLDVLAQELASAFPDLDEGRIISVGESALTINLGERDGVVKGMTAFVETGGDIIKDPETGEVLSSDVYVAEVYVVGVEKKTSKAIVSRKSADPRVGDIIKFK